MKRKQTDKDKRTRILDAAQALFASQGFDATTTKTISEEAGVATGLVFYYFKSKEEILSTLIEERTLAAELPAILEAALQDDPYTTLVTVGVRVLRTLEEREDLVRILLQEVVSSDKRAGEMPRLSDLFRRGRTRLARYLDEAAEAGRLEPVNTEVLAETFFASMFFHAIFLDFENSEAFVLETVRMLLRTQQQH